MFSFRRPRPVDAGDDYPYLRAWYNRLIGNDAWTAAARLEAARAAGAPPDAVAQVYRSGEGWINAWSTTRDVGDQFTLDSLHRWAQEYAGRRLPRPHADAGPS